MILLISVTPVNLIKKINKKITDQYITMQKILLKYYQTIQHYINRSTNHDHVGFILGRQAWFNTENQLMKHTILWNKKQTNIIIAIYVEEACKNPLPVIKPLNKLGL